MEDVELVFVALPFAQRKYKAGEDPPPLGWPVSLKIRSWKLSRSLYDSGSIAIIMRLSGIN